jgi:saccharopine dehydrogenase-like NADP-dependent oxidoreductase
MKLIVLGGAGDMASRAVRELAGEADVTALTIADYDLEAAHRLAQELGDKVSAVWVDANDHAALVDTIRGHDAAASGIGPFYRYEARVARAAIEAGVPYVSICDDYDAAEAVLALDEEAKAAGVTVLTGLGWTPGLSNVLARKGAEQFDLVDEINVSWGSSASDSEGYAVILHTLHIFTGQVPSFQKGRLVPVPAGTGKEVVLFPPPAGRVNCYHLGHPEPVTLPRFLGVPGVRTVTLKGGLIEQPLNDLAIWLGRLRLTDSPAKKDVLGQIIKATLPFLSKLGEAEQPISAVRVDVGGWKDNTYKQVSYGAAAHMPDLTGLPLAIGALMLARHEISVPGVVAPEACVEPEAFLADLHRRGVGVQDMTGQWPQAVAQPAGPSPLALALAVTAGWFLFRWLCRRDRR